jgi:hypothetical protein
MKKMFLALAATLSMAACSTYEVTPTGHTMKTTTDYMEVITKHSANVRRYSGFYNIFDMEATAITSDVAQAQLEQSSMLYQWEESRFAEEKGKFEARLSKETEFFLSFYTPDRKQDDLMKKTTIWKLFLDVDGKRYEGKATKLKLQMVEIEGLYPYHNRFYTPYSVIFPVSMRSIEGKPMKFTLTGAVGAGVMDFNP